MKATFVAVSIVAVAALGCTPAAARAQQADLALPKDISPDSRNRLPLVNRSELNEQAKKVYDVAASQSPTGRPEGVAAIRLHRSGVDVRWESPVGRALTELAILATAREHDQPYEWSLHEMEALAVGLEPAVIEIVRQRGSVSGLGDKEAAIIQIARENGGHNVAADTYERALKAFGRTNLVDIASLMGQYASTAARLTAFNQQMPPGWKQFLPLPFTPPTDVHSDSMSRLPLIRTAAAPAAAPARLYSRQMAPEGTGPSQLARHGAGLASLEASVGRRVMSVAALVAARAHENQYHWTMSELAARRDGVEPSVVRVIRDMQPPSAVEPKDAVLIQFGRELFGRHVVGADTYARALNTFGERDLVDLVALMAQHADDATVLTIFNQQLPVGQPPLLPHALN